MAAAAVISLPVFLASNAWVLRTMIEEWPSLRFKETRDQN
jgi:hypothetical protein